jgi:glutamate-ammonia-ligase adenylyltransferase
MASAVDLAAAHSPYLRALMKRRPTTVDAFVATGPFVPAIPDGPAAAALRTAKADIALVTALADLSGDWPLETVTRTLSDFADAALDVAVRTAIAERAPDADPKGFAVLALGKLGSSELNYSSDVDLIFLHDRATLPRRERDDPDEAAVRVARRVVELMQARDGDGYVFRVDLRLRPASEATPITIPVEGAESYYQSEALPWERAAFIRARACAGDLDMGRAFLDRIRPFVWRRSLDYTAIREIHDISLRIRDTQDGEVAPGPGFDLKKGRGGIREVEFFAQIHQLIFGGREPVLRAPATLDALAALAAAGRIPESDAATLAEAYRLLRTTEHRIQMRADEQTHAVPTDADARRAVAALCGAASPAALDRTLAAATRAVARCYDGLIAEARRSPAVTAPVPAEAQRLIDGWRAGGVRALRTPEARAAFEAVLPPLLAAFGEGDAPETALARLDSFLRALPGGVQFFALLERNPPLVGLLARLLGTAPLLADALARAPALLDVLLDPAAFAPLPGAAALTADLAGFAGQGDLEITLDRVRRWTAERRLQIGAQLLERRVDPLDAARAYSDLADAALAVVAPAVEASFAEAHGRVPGADLVVLALGRYGGRALTAKSDLDLVYLFTGDGVGESDGRRPLGATTWFNRLAQRLTAALSVPTAEGALYEVDTRLRPSGAQGLLAVSIDAFVRYQREEAWTWEHMALTRARVAYGPSGPAEAVIAEILARPRDPAKLRADVLDMRADMAKAKPPQGRHDVKLAPGGLVDLEFLVHFLQLRDRAGLTPDLGAAVAALRPDLSEAHDLMTRVLVTLRLFGGAAEMSPAMGKLLAHAAGASDLTEAERSIDSARAAVRAVWHEVFQIEGKNKI